MVSVGQSQAMDYLSPLAQSLRRLQSQGVGCFLGFIWRLNLGRMPFRVHSVDVGRIQFLMDCWTGGRSQFLTGCWTEASLSSLPHGHLHNVEAGFHQNLKAGKDEPDRSQSLFTTLSQKWHPIIFPMRSKLLGPVHIQREELHKDKGIRRWGHWEPS